MDDGSDAIGRYSVYRQIKRIYLIIRIFWKVREKAIRLTGQHLARVACYRAGSVLVRFVPDGYLNRCKLMQVDTVNQAIFAHH